MTPSFNQRIAALFSAFAILFLSSTAAMAATSVSQFGITWTFDRDYPTGQFANGDYWVVGPVKILSISPKSSNGMHGSMINPGVNGSQGFDSRIKGNTYNSALNVALKLPLTLQPGTSLLSAHSYTTRASGDNPQMKTLAILTVLDRAAPAGSFRPPYVGTDKTLRWNKSQLDYSKLRSLPVVTGAPSLSTVEANFARPWIELKTNWTGRYMHPDENQPTYGREIAHTLAEGLLALQLNYSADKKEKLLVRLVQYGIDVYGVARTGAKWNGDGGHNQGRKMPLMLAAAVLNDANMLAIADAKSALRFQEDQSTWYVSLYDVGRTLYTSDGRPREQYILGDVGIPEWGEKHTVDPTRDGRNWDAYYRTVTGSCTIGHVLAARLMGLENKWNWPATFDYYDRFWSKQKGAVGTSPNLIQPFVANMWKAYRNSTGADYTTDNTSTAEIWQNTAITAQSGSFTCSFDMVASQAKMEGVTGLSGGAADGMTDLAASVRFSPAGFIDAANGSTFQASTSLAYSAGVKYRVVISADVGTDKYSVKVTPAGGSTVTIASGFNFRSEQTSASKLANVGFMSKTGAHSVLNVGVTSNEPVTAPVTDPAPVTDAVSTPTSVRRINAGGAKYTDKAGRVWSADTGYDSGVTASTSSAIAGTEDDKLYQSNRYDNPRSAALLNYAFSLSNGDYLVRLMFAETSFTANGKRRFDVKAEGKLVLDNLDIHARVGAKRALVVELPVKVADGKLDLQFIPVTNNPQINAIEILRPGTTVASNSPGGTASDTSTQAPATGTSTGQAVARINAGGGQYVDANGRTWRADAYYDSGMTTGTSAGIAGTKDDRLYQSNRYDNPRSAALLNYHIPISNDTYLLRLHFAETHFTAKGKRRFDVKAEGKVVVRDLDIHARVGAKRPLVIEVPVKVQDGKLDLQFLPDRGAPQINAIEVRQG